MIFGEQIAGGIGSVAGGASAIYTGIGLLSFGPVGWIAGGVLMVVGVGAIAIGAGVVVLGIVAGTILIAVLSDAADNWWESKKEEWFS